MLDHAKIVDAPEWNGFFARGRFYPYVMGGAPDAPGAQGDTESGGDGGGDAGNQGNQSTTESDNSDGGKDDKKFSQDEVNSIVAKEVSKASRGKLDPKELGFDSSKDLKEFLDKMKEKTEAEKTEQEKALEDAIKAAKEEATSTITSDANARIVKAEFRLAGLEAGIPKDRLDDAFALAQLQDDWKDVAIDEESKDITGLDDDFFGALKKAKPFLFADEKTGGAGDIGAGAGGGGKVDDTKQLVEKYPALQSTVAASAAAGKES